MYTTIQTREKWPPNPDADVDTTNLQLTTAALEFNSQSCAFPDANVRAP